MEAEKFETSPILFGDFMKMGADPADRIYEELVDISKVKNLLADVSLLASLLSLKKFTSCLVKLWFGMVLT